ncbi:tyrosyl-DNA phosphodiesterase 2 isoform X1 [Coregonus clupeaformis]|uniref:tyrosyl-DNA phosphodiesterase 2 isoform X1 n=2 Tax=Coregonus clupeaformis TaxID=59861 RepID=UPI001E1C26B7|nr:tyrosyl-DNA phosphodiesterase 2 isoform X1 [Coregonus clupeaformis]
MGDKQQDSVERPADGNKNQTSDSFQQVTAPGNSKGRKKKRGKKKRSAEKMEDKEGEMGKSAPLLSVLVQPQSEKSNPAQSPSVQPDPPLGQSNREKPTPEKPKPAQRNHAQPPTGHQNPATLPSVLPSQAQPEQPNPVHPNLAQPPIDHLPLTQSRDQPPQAQPHPDQGPPTQLSTDQSSLQQSSPDQPDQSSPQQSSPDQPDQSSPQSSQSSLDEDKRKKKGDPNKLTLLTWNIDGLDLDDIKERLSRLLDYLIEYHPDIVLLQEVISPIYQVLQQVLKPYHVLPGSDRSYFTAILLRKSRVQLLESSIVNYPTTKMRRNLLMAYVSFLGHPLCVMTSHMESMKPQSLERQNQLRTVWKTMSEQPQDHNVIFGGDTNLRDWEVKNQGGLPEGICDVWESLGQPEDCRYTWDCVTNDNKDLPFPARLRFDRLFLRQAGKGSKISPDGMTLVGLERLDDCQRFTSDHWGLLCTFVMKPLSQATPE